MAQSRRQGLHLRGSDRRRRPRRQGRHLSAVQRRPRDRRRDRHHLHRFRGNRQHLPSGACLRPRSGRGGAVWRAIDACGPACCGVCRRPHLSADSELVHVIAQIAGSGAHTNRTRADVAVGGDGAACAGLWTAVARDCARHSVFASAADHVSDSVQSALDPERQVDRGAPGLVGALADDRRTDRPDDRLRHRTVAHPRDQPADQGRFSVGAERARGAGRRRRRRAHQWPIG